jgi:hypothetical protein
LSRAFYYLLSIATVSRRKGRGSLKREGPPMPFL